MNKKLQTFKYLFCDLVSAVASWSLFFIYRKVFIESAKYGRAIPIEIDKKFIMGLIFIPIFWVGLYFIAGTYRNIYRKSRLGELGQTLLITLIGVIIIFFALILDDTINTYISYYESFIVLFSLQFCISYFFRLLLTSTAAYKIHRRIIGFPSLLVGSNQAALKIYQELESSTKSSGNKFVGFVHLNGNNGHLMENHIPHLGSVENLRPLIKQHAVEEVIIAVESSEHKSIVNIINALDDTKVIVKIIPDMYDILSGSVKMNSIFSTALIEVSSEIMPAWQQTLKRAMDIFFSIFTFTFLSPVFIITAILVKFSSPGPVLYSHLRVGRHGKPFMMYKFRSMRDGAEQNVPLLSSKNDSRITPFGRIMRMTRLDEIPQFYNVLIGEMSIVGPRPERQYYIDRIVQIAPHYRHLHKVKPGITSWGQVKYGYAENVEQMVERLKYDLIYIENMSIAVDLKILIYTVLIVLQGRGK